MKDFELRYKAYVEALGKEVKEMTGSDDSANWYKQGRSELGSDIEQLINITSNYKLSKRDRDKLNFIVHKLVEGI